jgi:hypothetical protein
MEPVNGSEPGERGEGGGESKPLITSEDDSENGGEIDVKTDLQYFSQSRNQERRKWQNGGM